MLFLFQSVGEVRELLTIKDVSIVGVFIVIIALLLWERRSIKREHKKEVEIAREELKHVREKMEVEYKESNDEMKEMIGKYSEAVTRIFDILNHRP